jgi:hypothetical protein
MLALDGSGCVRERCPRVRGVAAVLFRASSPALALALGVAAETVRASAASMVRGVDNAAAGESLSAGSDTSGMASTAPFDAVSISALGQEFGCNNASGMLRRFGCVGPDIEAIIPDIKKTGGNGQGIDLIYRSKTELS